MSKQRVPNLDAKIYLSSWLHCYFYTFIINFDKKSAMLKNDASAAYRKKIINFRYACRKYYRHVYEDRGHRSSATFSSDRKQTHSLSLFLSLEGVCRRIFGKRNAQKKRGNWTAVGVDTCPTEMQHCPQANLAAVSKQWKRERRWGARPEQPFTFVS